ncbi:MAG: hypothetical protein AB9846_15895 [Tenuifilaceae bacterium]
MKTKSIVFTVILTISFALFAYSQAPTKVKLYSLLPNESLVYGENCFPLTENASGLFLVTQSSQGYFIFENGKRRGPISQMSAEMIKNCDRPQKSCAEYDSQNNGEENIFDKFIVAQDDGKFLIKFSGKTFGPYSQVYDIQLSKDKSKFAATVSDANRKKQVILSVGKTIALNGLPNRMYLSPDGTFAIVRYGFDFDVDNFDPSTINMETATQVNIITTDGAKFGPYNSDDFRDYYIWFCKTSPNHWIIKINGKYMLDGKTPLNIPEGLGNCDVWLSPDGKRFAYSNYEKIQFSDNTSIAYPFEYTVTEKEGKLFFRCISIENDRDIYVCTKTL